MIEISVILFVIASFILSHNYFVDSYDRKAEVALTYIFSAVVFGMFGWIVGYVLEFILIFIK